VNGEHQTIVADPPWTVKAGRGLMAEGFVGGKRSARPLAYPSMSVEEIAALPVASLGTPDAHLYLWTINRYVEDAFSVARAWGFEYSTLLTWCKKPMGGGLGGAWGISTEFVLFARRGSLPAIGKVTGTAFHHKRPYDERGKPKHSAKPPEFLGEVEQASPGPYLELFSRETKPRMGWDYAGDGSLGTVRVPGLRDPDDLEVTA
jgi:N6-adenosine-specific RNA methylase IME4